MKKLLLVFVLLSSFSFADEYQEMKEEKIENQLKMSLSNVIDYKTDYDVDIYLDKINIEVEIDSSNKITLDYQKIVNSVRAIIKNNAPEMKDINLIIKQDRDIGKDKILFNENI